MNFICIVCKVTLYIWVLNQLELKFIFDLDAADILSSSGLAL